VTSTNIEDKKTANNWKKQATYGAYAIVIILLAAWLGPLLADKAPFRIVQTTIGGVLVGGVYSLIALGIVVINKSSGVFNFAQGGMMMLGGFIFFSFFTIKDISVEGAMLMAVVMVVLLLTMAEWKALLDPRNLAFGALAVIVLTVLMSINANNFPWLGNENIAPNFHEWLAKSHTQLRWLHAIVGVIVGTVVLGLAIERFTIRPLIGQPLFTTIMMTLALSEILKGITLLVWDPQAKALMIFANTNVIGMEQRLTPIRIDANELLGGSISIEQTRLYAFAFSVIAFVAFWLFFRFTNVGLAMRATSEDQQIAQAVGLRVRMILAIAWGITAILAGVAGVLHGGSAQLDNNMHLIALRVFPAVLLGGLESIEGAFVGGLVIGLTEEYAKLLFGGSVGEGVAPYVILMIVLIIRPDGLFGQKRIERI
jgi:branched-chain amino acid transport system permease protein